MKSDYLFVYGTLLKDFDSYMSKFLNRNADFIGEAFIQGKLYEISWYPGVTLSKIPSEKVYGHLFKIYEFDKTFKILDDYEGIGETSSEHANEYRREIIEAFMNNGSIIKTWVYVYNNCTDDLKLIPSGNYIEQYKSD